MGLSLASSSRRRRTGLRLVTSRAAGLSFAFRTSSEILFGDDGARRAPELAAASGSRVLLVTGAHSLERSGVLDSILDRLDDLGAEVTRWTVPSEPDVSLVDAGAQTCRAAECTNVLAAGGGSVIDTAKAVAALAANGGSALDYLENVGDLGGGRQLRRQALPVVALPTTAGSGSEVTRNSVLRVPELAVKRSMRSHFMLPAAAVVDPALSAGAPVEIAAAAGLDALTHLIEAYVSKGAQPMTDALAVPGIRMAMGALRALADGSANAVSGEQMAVASLFGGIALANAGLGAVHGLVAPLGGSFSVPHGAACACLLPHTISANRRALAERMPGHHALSRYREIAAAAGLDALTHLIEAYVSKGAQPMTDALAVPGIRMAMVALRALADGSANAASGERMAVASLFGGIALANAGLGAVHGLVAPLGGSFSVPHGAACACLLPHTISANRRALAERMPGHPALSRYREIAAIVNGPHGPHGADSSDGDIEQAADALEELRSNLGVPPLRTFGVDEAAFGSMVAGSRGGSMRGNPIELTDDELTGILAAALASG